jgi:anthranilate phosphoribosyltransferase
MTDYTVTIVADYVQPTTEIATDDDYVDMVMNMAALSYMAQYGVATPEEGISAARAAFNSGIPPVTE